MMFGFGKRFKGVDKKFVKNPEIINDYNSSEAIGRVRLGKLYFYYKDLGTKFYVPYDYIDRVYTKEEMVQPDDSPPYFYYRIMLRHGDKDFANLIFEKKELVEKVYEKLRQIAPEIKYGLE